MVHYTMWGEVTDPVCTTDYKKVCKTDFPKGYPWGNISEEEAPELEVEEGMLSTQEGEEDAASEA